MNNRLNPTGGFWPAENKLAEAFARVERKLDLLLRAVARNNFQNPPALIAEIKEELSGPPAWEDENPASRGRRFTP